MTATTKSKSGQKAIAEVTGAKATSDILTIETVQARRTELEKELHAERQSRAAAAIAGEAFDPASLFAIEASLAALNDAETELTRRQRARDAELLTRELAVLRQRVPGLRDAWLDSIAEAEAAARAMVSAFDRAEMTRPT